MKYCPNCGSSVTEGCVYCPNCGKKLVDDVDVGGAGENRGCCGKGNYYGANANRGANYTVPPILDSHSTLSVIGFILSFFTAIVGLIVSIIAYSDAKRTGSSKSKSLSLAGIIISAVEIGVVVVIVCFYLFLVFIVWGSLYYCY